MESADGTSPQAAPGGTLLWRRPTPYPDTCVDSKEAEEEKLDAEIADELKTVPWGKAFKHFFGLIYFYLPGMVVLVVVALFCALAVSRSCEYTKDPANYPDDVKPSILHMRYEYWRCITDIQPRVGEVLVHPLISTSHLTISFFHGIPWIPLLILSHGSPRARRILGIFMAVFLARVVLTSELPHYLLGQPRDIVYAYTSNFRILDNILSFVFVVVGIRELGLSGSLLRRVCIYHIGILYLACYIPLYVSMVFVDKLVADNIAFLIAIRVFILPIMVGLMSWLALHGSMNLRVRLSHITPMVFISSFTFINTIVIRNYTYDLESLGSIAALNIFLGLAKCLSEITLREPIRSAMYKILTCEHVATALLSTPSNAVALVFIRDVELVAEYSSIFLVPLIRWAINVVGTINEAPRPFHFWLRNALMHFAVQVAIDLISFLGDMRFHGIPHIAVTRACPGMRRFAFWAISIYGLVSGVLSVYNLMKYEFCPIFSDDMDLDAPLRRINCDEQLLKTDPPITNYYLFGLLSPADHLHEVVKAPGSYDPPLVLPDAWYRNVRA